MTTYHQLIREKENPIPITLEILEKRRESYGSKPVTQMGIDIQV